MIKIVDLWHHYGVSPTLRAVNLTVHPGELLCVMGTNGMGKSTLLGCVAGVLAAVKGHIEVDGLRRSVEEEKQIRRRLVYLPAEPWVPSSASGREFLFAAGRLYSVEEDRLFDHVQRLLDLFDLGKHADQAISSYSTGQKKKIGICSALVTDARSWCSMRRSPAVWIPRPCWPCRPCSRNWPSART
jgi:ABC-2 type transport system ATP-binding protein